MSWSKVNRWHWWRPESAQETNPGPVQQRMPQTGWNTETETLHRLGTGSGNRPTSLTTQPTSHLVLDKMSPQCTQFYSAFCLPEPISTSVSPSAALSHIILHFHLHHPAAQALVCQWVLSKTILNYLAIISKSIISPCAWAVKMNICKVSIVYDSHR